MKHSIDWSAAQAVKLTPKERKALKQAIATHITTAPESTLAQVTGLTDAEKRSVKADIFSMVRSDSFVKTSLWDWLHLSRHFGYAVFTVVFIFTSTMGTLAYSAESAVPGDTLYDFKLYVNEPMYERMIWNEQDILDWHSKKLDRRLHEVQRVLQDPNRAEHFTLAVDRFERHAQHMEQMMAKLPEEKRQDLQERLEQKFSLQSEFIQNRKPNLPPEQLERFSESVERHHRRIAPRRPSIESDPVRLPTPNRPNEGMMQRGELRPFDKLPGGDVPEQSTDQERLFLRPPKQHNTQLPMPVAPELEELPELESSLLR